MKIWFNRKHLFNNKFFVLNEILLIQVDKKAQNFKTSEILKNITKKHETFTCDRNRKK